jgi:hypothetical protein
MGIHKITIDVESFQWGKTDERRLLTTQEPALLIMRNTYIICEDSLQNSNLAFPIEDLQILSVEGKHGPPEASKLFVRGR